MSYFGHRVAFLTAALVISAQLFCFADQGTGTKYPPPLWFQGLVRYLSQFDYKSGAGLEYESNIFLTPDGEDADIKTTFYQNISRKIIKEKTFFQFDYTANLSYYQDEAKLAATQGVLTAFSYRPFSKEIPSFGLSNYFRNTNQSKITTTLGDRLISLGFRENTFSLENKWPIGDYSSLAIGWQNYLIDARSDPTDDNIDHKINLFKVNLNRQLHKYWNGYVGAAYRDINFPDADTKDGYDQNFYLGLSKTFPNVYKLGAEVGVDGSHSAPVADERKNLMASIYLDSNFSTLTKVTASYRWHALYPSVRTDYSQYKSDLLSLSLRRYLNPKTILFSDLSFEKQIFDDRYALTSPATDRKTNIYSAGISLRRVLKSWLNLDAGYTYLKRDTDFADEGFTDNKVSLQLVASY